ncbi:MAG: ferritin-like domain-containing protein [Rhodospirillales bacterium]|nr:ferritin-like domain-containing protein [Rhodospirillales bacterium]
MTTEKDAGVNDVQSLTAKAQRAQWSLDADIDWTLKVKPPGWLARRAYVDAISQLLHAEHATRRVCIRLAVELADPAARAFLATQIADEDRHIAAYTRYLARLGDIAPADPALIRTFAAAEEWAGPPQGLLAAFHVVLESEAVRLQDEVTSWFPCPLFRAMNAAIVRDEARHVAFGRIWLGATVDALSPDQRVEIYRWVRGLWRDCAKVEREVGPLRGRFLRQLHAGYVEAKWPRYRRILCETGLIDDADAPADDAWVGHA